LSLEDFIYLLVDALPTGSELVVEEEVDESKAEAKEEEKVEVYQNERHYPIVGWSSKLLPSDWYNWSSLDGSLRVRKDEDFSDYDFTSQWLVNRRPHHAFPKADDKGWLYSTDFAMDAPWAARSNLFSTVRRRRWVRRGRRRAQPSLLTFASPHPYQKQQWQSILADSFPDSAMRLSLLDGEELHWRAKASLTGIRREKGGVQRYLHGTFYFTDYRVLFKVNGAEEARVNVPVSALILY
jgi:hypothetical protein